MIKPIIRKYFQCVTVKNISSVTYKILFVGGEWMEEVVWFTYLMIIFHKSLINNNLMTLLSAATDEQMISHLISVTAKRQVPNFNYFRNFSAHHRG